MPIAAVILLLLATISGKEVTRTMNTAYVRFSSVDGTIDVNRQSSVCHRCTYYPFFKSVGQNATEYLPIDMEFTQNFEIRRENGSIEYYSAKFDEYGAYTVTVGDPTVPFNVTTDIPGHNYYVPLYFMILLVFTIFSLVVFVENLRSYRKAKQNADQPLVEEEKKSSRVVSIDVFRGIALCCMIFANYHAGAYQKALVHAVWDGITFSDFAFPLFIFIQGISLRLSIDSSFRKNLEAGNSPFKATLKCTLKCLKRAIVLYILTWLVNCSKNFATLRILGVLAYFSVSGLVNSLILLYTPVYHFKLGFLSRWNARVNYKNDPLVHAPFDPILPFLCTFTHWLVAMFVAAPGCPRGYTGPGGISDFGRYEGCTGGIYRYIDVKVFGEEHIYHGSAVTYVYHGNNFECEGLMGLLNAIFLVYLGTLVTPVIQKVKKPMNHVWTYAVTGLLLLFIGGLLCGFKQYDGYMPINKNKWNTTFICITGGTGFVVFALVYLLVDVWKVWSGYPVKAMGMNSILIYIVHEFVHGYMPFT
ncbi:hypothetical protein WA538_001425, partial [Blastocystis sp. DL]